MVGPRQAEARAAVLDTRAVGVFAAEIREMLGGDVTVSIFDGQSRAVWSSDRSSADAPPAAPPNEPLAAPIKRHLGAAAYAYDFPLESPTAPALTLRVLLRSLDPPSLGDVTKLVRPTIQCLSRQIDIDTSLTSSFAVPPRAALEAGLIAQITSYEWQGTLERTVRGIVQTAHTGLACHGIAIAIPSLKLILIESGDPALGAQLKPALARLQGSVNEKRKVISARFTLPSGAETKLICAPVLDGPRDVAGLVVVVHDDPGNLPSKVARTLSTKVAGFAHAQPNAREILNRAELIERIDAIQKRQPTQCHSLIYFDADKLHAVNDAFGYSAGDRALGHLKRIILGSAGTNDAVAHLTSDRFALLMPGATTDTAVAKAEQILRLYAQESIDDESKSIRLSTSAGIAATPAISKGGEELLILAEVAARGAKERGGNQFALYQDIDGSLIQRRSDVDKVGFLQMALIENRFALYAQRIEAIGVESNQKFELLTRLDDRHADAAHPGELLSAAERYHLMAALDRWVVNSALKAIAEAEYTLEVSLSTFCINVSAQSLRDDEIVDHIESRIAETGVAPDTLCFEITETSLVKHIDRAQRFVSRLQRIGCQVALDDFGTGYSSFSYLKSLPVNYLKIDGSFVRDILENNLSQTIVASIVQIADVIGALTVAEHVENALVRTRLKDLGVHFVQGFAIHKPEPFAQVLARLGEPIGTSSGSVEMIDLGDYLTPAGSRRASS